MPHVVGVVATDHAAIDLFGFVELAFNGLVRGPIAGFEGELDDVFVVRGGGEPYGQVFGNVPFGFFERDVGEMEILLVHHGHIVIHRTLHGQKWNFCLSHLFFMSLPFQM